MVKKLLDFLRKYRKDLLLIFSYCLLFGLFFSPTLWEGAATLSPGDAGLLSKPIYEAGVTVWTDSVGGGYPGYADPQYANWYPVKLLLSGLGFSFGIYVISAFVIAASLAYLLARSLKQSRLAAYTAGLAFGLTGIMIAHLGHTNMIHSIAWLPGIAWGIQRYYRSIKDNNTEHSKGWRWLGVMAIFTGVLGLAGHPQILFYALLFTVIYTLLQTFVPKGQEKFRWPVKEELKRILVVGLFSIVGVGMAMIQLLPTVAFQQLTVRQEMSFHDFESYSFSLASSPLLVYPYFYGSPTSRGIEPNPFTANFYTGPENMTEVSNYLGILVLILAGLGVAATWKQKEAKIWLIMAILFASLAFMTVNPLSGALFEIPGFNLFRAHGRFFFISSLGVALFAGWGVARLERSAKSLVKAMLVGGVGLVLANLLMIMFANHFATEFETEKLPSLPWENPVFLWPVLIWSLGLGWSVMLSKLEEGRFKGGSLHRYFLWGVVALVVIDLGMFGWLYEWRFVSKDYAVAAAVERVGVAAAANNKRIVSLDGVSTRLAHPNASLNNGSQNLSIYTPLLLSQFSDSTSMDISGSLNVPYEYGTMPEVLNGILDTWAVQYIISNNPLPTSSHFTLVESSAEGFIYENMTEGIVRVENIPTSSDTAQISKLLFENQKIQFSADVEAGSEAEVTVAINDYPGWEAFANGESIEITKTSDNQMQLELPEGSHNVELLFRPREMYLGAMISLASLGGLLGKLWWPTRKQE